MRCSSRVLVLCSVCPEIKLSSSWASLAESATSKAGSCSSLQQLRVGLCCPGMLRPGIEVLQNYLMGVPALACTSLELPAQCPRRQLFLLPLASLMSERSSAGLAPLFSDLPAAFTCVALVARCCRHRQPERLPNRVCAA